MVSKSLPALKIHNSKLLKINTFKIGCDICDIHIYTEFHCDKGTGYTMFCSRHLQCIGIKTLMFLKKKCFRVAFTLQGKFWEASRHFSGNTGQCFGGPHHSSTGDPAELVTPIGCSDGEGIALGEGEGSDGAVAADGGAEGAALLQLTVAQVQRSRAAVGVQPPEGAVQVPGPGVRVGGLWLQSGPLVIAALQGFITALGNLPQDGVHFRAILPRSADQLLQAPFGLCLEQEGLGRRPTIPGLCDHQLLRKTGKSAALGPAGPPGFGACKR